jgi:hypothetical protein
MTPILSSDRTENFLLVQYLDFLRFFTIDPDLSRTELCPILAVTVKVDDDLFF